MDRPALEQKHANLGLRFTPGGLGGVPVQAYGWLGDDRFYFRFRHDCAELSVGPFDTDLETADWVWSELSRLDRQAAKKDDEWMLDEHAQPMPTADDPRFYPTRVTRYAFADDVTGERHAGFLEEDEFCDLFDKMLTQLEAVPEDRQLWQIVIDNLEGIGLWPVPPAEEALKLLPTR